MMKDVIGKVVMASALLLAGLTANNYARAFDAASFYKGKNIDLIIASGPGGFDFVGRLVARHLGDHIPGHPNVVPQNMPGAGGLVAANYVFRRGRPDGTMLAQLPANLILEDVLHAPGVAYKSAQFNMIGRIASGINLTVVRSADTKVQTIQDAMSNPTRLATTGPASLVEVFPNVLNHLGGTQFKFISGYSDTASTMLAVERGEADAATIGLNSLYSLRRGWLTNGAVRFLVQYTPTRSPRLPNVPAVTELVKSKEDQAVLKLFLTAVTLGQYITAPPNVPAERLKVLRDAFSDMLKDPAFLKDIEDSNTWFDPMGGEELQKQTAVGPIDSTVLEKARAIRFSENN
ncbi:hypothetical protein A9R05_41005 (plasmid) [Burkholderia sp. KK1]|nr:hypothetical protein A9R05_41005 [Burkholderia sp. KK1]